MKIDFPGFVPRALDGFLAGLVFKGVSNFSNVHIGSLVTGFCTAFFNTLFFMSALIILFGNTEYVQGLRGGKNVITFVATFVGINAVFEMITCTIITGAIGLALYKAGFIQVKKTGES